MKVVYRNRMNETITRSFEFGSNSLVGMRIDELIIESDQEFYRLMHPKDENEIKWRQTILHSFRAKVAGQT